MARAKWEKMKDKQKLEQQRFVTEKKEKNFDQLPIYEGMEKFEVSNEEIVEIYVQRWQIELLQKFLKMHLKLDRLMTKNENGIHTISIVV